MSLSEAESQRFSRQIALAQVGVEGQERLKAARVLIVGSGGLGSPALTYLTAAGIGTIGIIDGDRVQISNLHRQTLFTEGDLGRSKVAAASRSLRALNINADIHEYDLPLTACNVCDVFKGYDLILDGSDNFATRYLVNDACVTLNKPFISASVFQFEGQLSVFNAKQGEARGPTYRCLFAEPPPPEVAPSCAEIGVLGTVPGTFGLLQANEALKLILKIGEPLIGRLLVLNLLTLESKVIGFKRTTDALRRSELRDHQYYAGLNPACSTAAPNLEVADVSADQVDRWLKEGFEFELLDVREAHERAKASIGGVHIPLQELPARLSELSPDRPLVVYCQSGARSKRAAQLIREKLGRADVSNLAGGVVAWISLNLEKPVFRPEKIPFSTLSVRSFMKCPGWYRQGEHRKFKSLK
jgi:molybdopterin/thiamine biosynthesis adenylyltransferase/rhodanese-related sulfurtransferase